MYKPRSPLNSSKYNNMSPSPSSRKKANTSPQNHIEIGGVKSKSRLSNYVQNVKT